MKKIISVLLAALMLFSTLAALPVTSFAASNYSMKSAQTLKLNGSVSGKMTESEVNNQKSKYYKITTEKAGKLTVKFSHATDYSGACWYVAVCDAEGVAMQEFGDAMASEGARTFTTIGVAANQTYYVKVADVWISQGVNYTVSCTFSATNGEYETEKNDTLKTADTLPLGKDMSGTFVGYYDTEDYYKFTTASAGKIVLKFSHGVNSDGGAYEVSLQNSEGVAIETATVYISEGSYTFTPIYAKANQTYYVRVYNMYYAEGIAYKLQSTFTKNNGTFEAENNNTAQTANTITPGKSMTGILMDNIDADDYYKITVKSNCKLTVSFSHAVKDTSGYWSVSLLDASGQELYSQTVEPMGGGYSFYPLGLDKNSVCYIHVNGYNVSGVAYTIKTDYVKTKGDFESEKNNSFKQADALTLGKTMKGLMFNGYDIEDYYKVKTNAFGQLKVTVKQNATENGSSHRVKLYDSSKKLIDEQVTYQETPTVNLSDKVAPNTVYYVVVCNEYYTEGLGYQVKATIANKAPVAVSKLTKGKKQFTAKWKKLPNATGYELQYSTDKNFSKKTTNTVKITSGKTTSKTVKGLKKNKKYYVRVRAYQTVKKKTTSSKWSDAKTVTIKK